MLENLPFRGELYSLATALTWAWAVILFRKSGETVHPLALSMFKSILALLLFLATMFIIGDPIFPSASMNDCALLLVSGIIGIGLCDTLFFMSLNLLGAGLSAIVDCLYSPFIISLSVLFLHESLGFLQAIGAGLIVSAVLTASRAKAPGGLARKDLIRGIWYGVLAMAANAIGIVMIKPVLAASPILWVTSVRLISGCAFLAVILWTRKDRRRVMSTLLDRGRGYTLSSALVGGYLAMILWLAGMKFTLASTAAALNQTSNIFVFILAALFLREPITRIKLLGISLGVVGALLVTFGH